MIKLSVFKNPYHFFSQPIKWLDWFFHSLLWAWQRATLGYCSMDIINMDEYVPLLLASSLETFSDMAHGCPMSYIEENEDLERAHADWKNTVYNTAQLFKASVKEYENPYKYYIDSLQMNFNEDGTITIESSLGTDEEIEGLRAAYVEEEQNISNKKDEYLRKAFEELAHICPNLWD